MYIYINHTLVFVHICLYCLCMQNGFNTKHQMNMNQSRPQLKRIYERQISIYIDRENINGKTRRRRRPKKTPLFMFVCLFLVGTKCQNILTTFPEASSVACGPAFGYDPQNPRHPKQITPSYPCRPGKVVSALIWLGVEAVCKVSSERNRS